MDAGAQQKAGDERSQLLASLADLDEELQRGEIDAHDHTRLRALYLERVARVDAPDLEEDGNEARRESAGSATNAAEGTEVGAPVGRSKPRRWLLVAGICCIASAVAVFAVVSLVSGSSTRRPGQEVSGGSRLSASQQLVISLGQAQMLEEEGRYTEALDLYNAILASHPRQPEALAYRGWILQLAAEQVGGNTAMEQNARHDETSAIAADPSYADPHFFLGTILYTDYHDTGGAIAQFGSFLADKPAPVFVALARPTLVEVYAAAGQPLPAAAGAS